MKNKKIQIKFFKKKNIDEKLKSIDKESLRLFSEMMRDRWRNKI